MKIHPNILTTDALRVNRRQAGQIATTPEALRAFADSLLASDEVAIEATGNTHAIVKLIAPRVARVVDLKPDEDPRDRRALGADRDLSLTSGAAPSSGSATDGSPSVLRPRRRPRVKNLRRLGWGAWRRGEDRRRVVGQPITQAPKSLRCNPQVSGQLADSGVSTVLGGVFAP